MDVFETGFPVQDDRRFSPIIVLLPPWVWEWHVIRPPIHNLLRCVLPGLRHSMLLPYQFVSLPLVQNLPGTQGPSNCKPACKIEQNGGPGARKRPDSERVQMRDVPVIAKGTEDLSLLPGMSNRHGLVAGARGTGKA